MKYFLIAGEASGDLHAAHLMRALLERDPSAQFQYYGGDHMAAVGGDLLCHYRYLAYMGFIPVLLHARTILRGLKRCKQEIAQWRPDVVILVDYPGFNLKVARYVTREQICPVHYYISPKIWAWKEHRIRAIRRDITRLFTILPFETSYFLRRHNYPVTYVGNPSHEEVAAYLRSHPTPTRDEKLIALLPGSRRQEIRGNLSIMLHAAAPYIAMGYKVSIAVAPAVERQLYDDIIRRTPIHPSRISLTEGDTYGLLRRSHAALVTSGTATLEAALLGTPMAVCYHTGMGWLVSLLRRLFLRTPYVSLANLIGGYTIVPELIAGDMSVSSVSNNLKHLLINDQFRADQLRGFDEITRHLGSPDASHRAAQAIIEALTQESIKSSSV